MGAKIQVECLTEGFVVRIFDSAGHEVTSRATTGTGEVVRQVNAWLQANVGRSSLLPPTQEG